MEEEKFKNTTVMISLRPWFNEETREWKPAAFYWNFSKDGECWIEELSIAEEINEATEKYYQSLKAFNMSKVHPKDIAELWNYVESVFTDNKIEFTTKSIISIKDFIKKEFDKINNNAKQSKESE
jgi:hypothetical protein